MTAMIRKYRTGWSNAIESVDCTKETNNCVWPSDDKYGRRELKRSDYRQYHDTWAEAKLYLVTKCERETANAQRMLAATEKRLRTVNALTDEVTT